MQEKTAQRLLKVFLDADLHYQLNGTPHHEYLRKQQKKYYGATRRKIRQVADLGPDAKIWMGYFIQSMEED